MKTWIVIFEYDGVRSADECANRYCRDRGIEPISVSMSFKDDRVFLAVVVKESEDTE